MSPPGSATSLPSVQFRDFEGPLDLLLDEVRRQNVEIDKIAMAPMVSRFLEYMGTAAERNLNLDIDWLHGGHFDPLEIAVAALPPRTRRDIPKSTRSATDWCSNSWIIGSRRPRN